MGEHDFFSFSFSFFFLFFFSSRKLPPSSHAPIRHLPRETSSIDYSSILAEYVFHTSRSLALRDIDFFSSRRNGKTKSLFQEKEPRKESERTREKPCPLELFRLDVKWMMKSTPNLIWTNFESERRCVPIDLTRRKPCESEQAVFKPVPSSLWFCTQRATLFSFFFSSRDTCRVAF